MSKVTYVFINTNMRLVIRKGDSGDLSIDFEGEYGDGVWWLDRDQGLSFNVGYANAVVNAILLVASEKYA